MLGHRSSRKSATIATRNGVTCATGRGEGSTAWRLNQCRRVHRRLVMRPELRPGAGRRQRRIPVPAPARPNAVASSSRDSSRACSRTPRLIPADVRQRSTAPVNPSAVGGSASANAPVRPSSSHSGIAPTANAATGTPRRIASARRGRTALATGSGHAHVCGRQQFFARGVCPPSQEHDTRYRLFPT